MLITAIRAIYGISHNKPRKVKSRVSYTVMGRLSRTERTKKTKKTKKTGAMGGGLVGGMALCPPAGPWAVTFPCGMVLSYFVPCPLRPLCPYPSFSRLSVSALHIVYCQPTLSFFRTDTIHIFPKTAIFQKIFFKCLKLPVKQYGTLF